MAFRDLGGFLLGDGFVPHGVKGFAAGVNLLQPALREDAFEFLLNQRDAGLQGGELVVFRLRFAPVVTVLQRGGSARRIGGVGGGLCHFKMVEDGQQLLNQGGAGELRGFNAFTRGAFFEIFQVGSRAQEAVPMFVSLGRTRLEFFEPLWGEFNCGGKVGRRRFGRAS